METITMRFKLKDIQPNPFRNMDRYPIRRDKITALRESVRTTGYWGNIVGRVTDGRPQLAYGHHRLVALREELGPSAEVDLIIRKLDDETMLQIMARENMEEWGSSAAVEHETIRAVVQAYAEGRVQLKAPASGAKKSEIRYAPSFVPNDPQPVGDHLGYTASSIARFIGWTQPDGRPQRKVYAALDALQFIEEGILKESVFDGLTTMQAEAVIEEARRARDRREAAAKAHRREAQEAERAAEKAKNETERRTAERRAAAANKRVREFQDEGRKAATKVGKAVSESIKEGKKGYKQAAEVASQIDTQKNGELPEIDSFARRLGTDLNHILRHDDDPRVTKLNELVMHAEALSPGVRKNLIDTLRTVAKRAQAFAERLEVKGRKPALLS